MFSYIPPFVPGAVSGDPSTDVDALAFRRGKRPAALRALRQEPRAFTGQA